MWSGPGAGVESRRGGAGGFSCCRKRTRIRDARKWSGYCCAAQAASVAAKYAGSQSPTGMANAAPPDAPVPTLAVPLEQLRHLAEELRLLLPGVRGELTQWRRTPTGTGVGREKPGQGGGGTRERGMGESGEGRAAGPGGSGGNGGLR